MICQQTNTNDIMMSTDKYKWYRRAICFCSHWRSSYHWDWWNFYRQMKIWMAGKKISSMISWITFEPIWRPGRTKSTQPIQRTRPFKDLVPFYAKCITAIFNEKFISVKFNAKCIIVKFDKKLLNRYHGWMVTSCGGTSKETVRRSTFLEIKIKKLFFFKLLKIVNEQYWILFSHL